MAAGVFAGSVRAEGVTGGGAFISGNGDISLVSALGEASLTAELVSTTPSPTPTARNAPRSASPQERIENQAGGELFPHLRLALPLVVHATVGVADEASLMASVRAMSGPMVGVRPHPRTWGSMLDR